MSRGLEIINKVEANYLRMVDSEKEFIRLEFSYIPDGRRTFIFTWDYGFFKQEDEVRGELVHVNELEYEAIESLFCIEKQKE